MGPVKPKFAYKCYACEDTFRMLEEFRDHNRNNPQCLTPNKKKTKPNEEVTTERQSSPTRSRRKDTMVYMTDLASDFSETETSDKGKSRHSSTEFGARSQKARMPEVQCSYTGCSATREFQAGIDLHYEETHGPKTFLCPLESECDAAFGVYHLLVDHLKCDHRLGLEQLRNIGIGVISPGGKICDLTPPDMGNGGGKTTTPGANALPTESEKPGCPSLGPKKGDECPASVPHHQEQPLSSPSIPYVEPAVSESGTLSMPTQSLPNSGVRKQQKQKASRSNAPKVLATGSTDPVQNSPAQQARQQRLLQRTINDSNSHPNAIQQPQYQLRTEPYNTYFGLETAHAAGDIETEWNCHQLLSKMTLQEKRLEQQQYIQDPRFLLQQLYILETRQQGLRQLLLRQQQQRQSTLR